MSLRPAFAACTSPTGANGALVYNAAYNVMEYCNSSTWTTLGPIVTTNPGTSCASPSGIPGQMIYNTAYHVLQYCNTYNWIKMGPSPGAGGSGCVIPTDTEGTVIFSSNLNAYQYCDGTNWVQMAGQACPKSGLLDRWKFNEGSGTSAYDSVNGQTVTLNGSPTWGRNGVTGDDINFNGTSAEYGSVPRNAIFEPVAVSVSLWIKPNSGGSQVAGASFLAKDWEGASSPTYASYQLQYTYGVSTIAWSIGISGNAIELDSHYSVPNGVWTHMVGTYDPAASAPQQKIYVNGVLDNSATLTSAIVYDTTHTGVSGGLIIGGQGGTNLPFNGEIDDVRIYNRALTSTEVSELYGNGSGCP